MTRSPSGRGRPAHHRGRRRTVDRLGLLPAGRAGGQRPVALGLPRAGRRGRPIAPSGCWTSTPAAARCSPASASPAAVSRSSRTRRTFPSLGHACCRTASRSALGPVADFPARARSSTSSSTATAPCDPAEIARVLRPGGAALDPAGRRGQRRRAQHRLRGGTADRRAVVGRRGCRAAPRCRAGGAPGRRSLAADPLPGRRRGRAAAAGGQLADPRLRRRTPSDPSCWRSTGSSVPTAPSPSPTTACCSTPSDRAESVGPSR